MKLKNPEGWNASIEANDDDGYARAVMLFAEAWADIMESRINLGERLEDIANETSHAVDRALGRAGVTVFQYGTAVATLAEVWVHGEKLRRWHNLDTQLGDEGEQANRKGTTLARSPRYNVLTDDDDS